jgi:ATP-dependent exoDNAse (exonuclease V) beta subunit
MFEEGVLEYHLGEAVKLSAKNVASKPLKTIPLVTNLFDPKKIKIAQREALMWGTFQQGAIEYGNVIHEILSLVKTIDDVALAITKAIEDGLITVAQHEVVFETINKIVTHVDLQSYFDENYEILNEQTIIQKEGKALKPDRIVIKPNKEVYLLDYKTGQHQAKYQLQLESYQGAIEKMGYQVTKKALIYIGEQINIVNL